MMFRWHYALGLLLAVPLLAGYYVVRLRRDRELGRRYPGLGLLRPLASGAAGYKTYLPPLCLFASVTLLLLAVARPVLLTTAPAREGTVVLLMDVSLSMAASDVLPTRLAAAQAAARKFIEAQPPDVRIAVVAFGGYADLVQPPTLDRAQVLAAIDRLELQRFTAIGNGLVAALLTLMPDAEIPHQYDVFGAGRVPAGAYDIRPLESRATGASAREPVAPGSYLSGAVILVSDGYSIMGVPTAAAAKLLAQFGVRVYAVGVGSEYGGAAIVDGWDPIHAEFSEDSLREIAAITHGEYFHARNADRVQRIYEQLGRRVVLARREFELTVGVTALGGLLLLASAGLSLAWSTRPA